jgi:uncharacterized protein (AIM24 family)
LSCVGGGWIGDVAVVQIENDKLICERADSFLAATDGIQIKGGSIVGSGRGLILEGSGTYHLITFSLVIFLL